MPLPIILGIAAGAAALAGVGSGIAGGVKMKEANDTMESAKRRHQKNTARFEEQNKITSERMDEVGTLELEILKSFDTFTTVFEKIDKKPKFKELTLNGIKLPKYNPEELKNFSVGAEVLLGGLGGASLGTAGAFAAGGATMAAVTALGTASTGTAIVTLSGAAATNAALAALGGGALAAGGGGMALGSMILGGATLGVGLLVGGIIFGITGSKLSDKADEAYAQMKNAENEINKICAYFDELRGEADKFYSALQKVNWAYLERLNGLRNLADRKTDWNDFTQPERTLTENTVLLVGLLYAMCKTQLVLKAEREGELNKVNASAIADAVRQSEEGLKAIAA